MTQEWTTVITGDRIYFVQMLARRAALKLEMKGLHRHGRSAYVIIKEAHGFKGSRAKVLEQYSALIEQKRAELSALP
jgi:hypothetical protein